VKIVCSGAGAAAMACLDLLVDLGAQRQNIFVCDSKGVLTVARHLDGERPHGRRTPCPTLSE
jgi:malate dehydrogenase (oxaloacetate-decarboxylating)(NADP+)